MATPATPPTPSASVAIPPPQPPAPAPTPTPIPTPPPSHAPPPPPERVMMNGLEVPASAARAYEAALASCVERAKQRGLRVNVAPLPNPLPSVDLLRLHTVLLSCGTTRNLCSPALFGGSRGVHNLLSEAAPHTKMEHLMRLRELAASVMGSSTLTYSSVAASLSTLGGMANFMRIRVRETARKKEQPPPNPDRLLQALTQICVGMHLAIADGSPEASPEASPDGGLDPRDHVADVLVQQIIRLRPHGLSCTLPDPDAVSKRTVVGLSSFFEVTENTAVVAPLKAAFDSAMAAMQEASTADPALSDAELEGLMAACQTAYMELWNAKAAGSMLHPAVQAAMVNFSLFGRPDDLQTHLHTWAELAARPCAAGEILMLPDSMDFPGAPLLEIMLNIVLAHRPTHITLHTLMEKPMPDDATIAAMCIEAATPIVMTVPETSPDNDEDEDDEDEEDEDEEDEPSGKSTVYGPPPAEEDRHFADGMGVLPPALTYTIKPLDGRDDPHTVVTDVICCAPVPRIDSKTGRKYFAFPEARGIPMSVPLARLLLGLPVDIGAHKVVASAMHALMWGLISAESHDDAPGGVGVGVGDVGVRIVSNEDGSVTTHGGFRLAVAGIRSSVARASPQAVAYHLCHTRLECVAELMFATLPTMLRRLKVWSDLPEPTTPTPEAVYEAARVLTAEMWGDTPVDKVPPPSATITLGHWLLGHLAEAPSMVQDRRAVATVLLSMTTHLYLHFAVRRGNDPLRMLSFVRMENAPFVPSLHALLPGTPVYSANSSAQQSPMLAGADLGYGSRPNTPYTVAFLCPALHSFHESTTFLAMSTPAATEFLKTPAGETWVQQCEARLASHHEMLNKIDMDDEQRKTALDDAELVAWRPQTLPRHVYTAVRRQFAERLHEEMVGKVRIGSMALRSTAPGFLYGPPEDVPALAVSTKCGVGMYGHSKKKKNGSTRHALHPLLVDAIALRANLQRLVHSLAHYGPVTEITAPASGLLRVVTQAQLVVPGPGSSHGLMTLPEDKFVSHMPPMPDPTVCASELRPHTGIVGTPSAIVLRAPRGSRATRRRRPMKKRRQRRSSSSSSDEADSTSSSSDDVDDSSSEEDEAPGGAGATSTQKRSRTVSAPMRRKSATHVVHTTMRNALLRSSTNPSTVRAKSKPIAPHTHPTQLRRRRV